VRRKCSRAIKLAKERIFVREVRGKLRQSQRFYPISTLCLGPFACKFTQLRLVVRMQGFPNLVPSSGVHQCCRYDFSTGGCRLRYTEEKVIDLGRCIVSASRRDEPEGSADDVTARAIFYCQGRRYIADTIRYRGTQVRKCTGLANDWPGSFLHFCRSRSNYTFQGCHR
jgi:hypothetical protein